MKLEFITCINVPFLFILMNSSVVYGISRTSHPLLSSLFKTANKVRGPSRQTYVPYRNSYLIYDATRYYNKFVEKYGRQLVAAGKKKDEKKSEKPKVPVVTVSPSLRPRPRRPSTRRRARNMRKLYRRYHCKFCMNYGRRRFRQGNNRRRFTNRRRPNIRGLIFGNWYSRTRATGDAKSQGDGVGENKDISLIKPVLPKEFRKPGTMSKPVQSNEIGAKDVHVSKSTVSSEKVIPSQKGLSKVPSGVIKEMLNAPADNSKQDFNFIHGVLGSKAVEPHKKKTVDPVKPNSFIKPILESKSHVLPIDVPETPINNFVAPKSTIPVNQFVAGSKALPPNTLLSSPAFPPTFSAPSVNKLTTHTNNIPSMKPDSTSTMIDHVNSGSNRDGLSGNPSAIPSLNMIGEILQNDLSSMKSADIQRLLPPTVEQNIQFNRPIVPPQRIRPFVEMGQASATQGSVLSGVFPGTSLVVPLSPVVPDMATLGVDIPNKQLMKDTSISSTDQSHNPMQVSSEISPGLDNFNGIKQGEVNNERFPQNQFLDPITGNIVNVVSSDPVPSEVLVQNGQGLIDLGIQANNVEQLSAVNINTGGVAIEIPSASTDEFQNVIVGEKFSDNSHFNIPSHSPDGFVNFNKDTSVSDQTPAIDVNVVSLDLPTANTAMVQNPDFQSQDNFAKPVSTDFARPEIPTSAPDGFLDLGAPDGFMNSNTPDGFIDLSVPDGSVDVIMPNVVDVTNQQIIHKDEHLIQNNINIKQLSINHMNNNDIPNHQMEVTTGIENAQQVGSLAHLGNHVEGSRAHEPHLPPAVDTKEPLGGPSHFNDNQFPQSLDQPNHVHDIQPTEILPLEAHLGIELPNIPATDVNNSPPLDIVVPNFMKTGGKVLRREPITTVGNSDVGNPVDKQTNDIVEVRTVATLPSVDSASDPTAVLSSAETNDGNTGQHGSEIIKDMSNTNVHVTMQESVGADTTVDHHGHTVDVPGTQDTLVGSEAVGIPITNSNSTPSKDTSLDPSVPVSDVLVKVPKAETPGIFNSNQNGDVELNEHVLSNAQIAVFATDEGKIVADPGSEVANADVMNIAMQNEQASVPIVVSKSANIVDTQKNQEQVDTSQQENPTTGVTKFDMQPPMKSLSIQSQQETLRLLDLLSGELVPNNIDSVHVHPHQSVPETQNTITQMSDPAPDVKFHAHDLHNQLPNAGHEHAHTETSSSAIVSEVKQTGIGDTTHDATGHDHIDTLAAKDSHTSGNQGRGLLRLEDLLSFGDINVNNNQVTHDATGVGLEAVIPISGTSETTPGSHAHDLHNTLSQPSHDKSHSGPILTAQAIDTTVNLAAVAQSNVDGHAHIHDHHPNTDIVKTDGSHNNGMLRLEDLLSAGDSTMTSNVQHSTDAIGNQVPIVLTNINTVETDGILSSAPTTSTVEHAHAVATETGAKDVSLASNPGIFADAPSQVNGEPIQISSLEDLFSNAPANMNEMIPTDVLRDLMQAELFPGSDFPQVNTNNIKVDVSKGLNDSPIVGGSANSVAVDNSVQGNGNIQFDTAVGNEATENTAQLIDANAEQQTSDSGKQNVEVPMVVPGMFASTAENVNHFPESISDSNLHSHHGIITGNQIITDDIQILDVAMDKAHLEAHKREGDRATHEHLHLTMSSPFDSKTTP